MRHRLPARHDPHEGVPPETVADAPADFLHKEFRSKDLAGHRLTIQVAPDDCTGCGVCVDVCPAKSKTEVRHKAINMEPVLEHRDTERRRWDYFDSIPPLDRDLLPHDTVKGSQVLRAALRVLGRVRGVRRDAVPQAGDPALRRPDDRRQRHRLLVDLRRQPADHAVDHQRATAAARRGTTRCSRTTPSSGSAMRLGLDAQGAEARVAARGSRHRSATTSTARCSATRRTPSRRSSQQRRSSSSCASPSNDRRRDAVDDERAAARRSRRLVGSLVRQGVWIIGGDGWAYDIGFGGLDHVLSSGRNVNVLVLDTEVYSNTGGQASKATPSGRVGEVRAAGKSTSEEGPRRDRARPTATSTSRRSRWARNELQTTKALLEADAWPGPSLVIAYSTCIAHGIDMSKSMTHQKDAVRSGYWPLYRFHPSEIDDGQPFKLDSHKPTIPIREFAATETRFAVLERTHPERAAHLAALAQADADETVALLRAARRDAADRSARTDRPAITPDVESDAGYVLRASRRNRERAARSEYPLPRPRAPFADRGLGLAAQRSASTACNASRTRGAAAIVMPSLFEEEILFEEIELNRSLEAGSEHFAEALDYFPAVSEIANAGRSLPRPHRAR